MYLKLVFERIVEVNSNFVTIILKLGNIVLE